MRIRSLHISDFKNLRNFDLTLAPNSPVSVLVGRNGTGKSNILEALTLIFRDLDLGNPASLTYDITYQCRGHEISISAKLGEKAVEATIDGERVVSAAVVGESGRQARPDFVFGYYSGPSNRLEHHFIQHQEKFYRDLVNGVENPLRPLFFARTVHSNFVLLAFFVGNDNTVREFLSEHLGVERFDSVLFEMQKPTWKSKSGDPRFWFARGTVQVLLDRLYRLSMAPLRLSPQVRVGMRRPTRNEHLYLYLSGLDAVRSLRQTYSSDQEFFKALESTYISELIYDVRIRVALRKSKGALTFRELSEGEQQLLLVLGLMRFTREEESLFLLDEPDTHLNPSWSARYRTFLERYGGMTDESHVLMATHDPLVISAMTKEEVRILERDEADGQVRALEPLEDPLGMGVANLLTSDVYGMSAALPDKISEMLSRKRELAAIETRTAEDEEELALLASTLEDLPFVYADDDPDYQDYLRARYHDLRAEPSPIVRSQAEVEEDREAVADLVRQVLESRRSE